MKSRLLLIFIISLLYSNYSMADLPLRAAGSSTVFPFITTISEEFGQKSDYNAPIVEATGTGGGFKLFCHGVGGTTIDFTNASREIKASEIELCSKNGVTNITEIKMGYDGIILANSVDSQKFNLSRQEIFLALAKLVPDNGKLTKNHYKYWNEINPNLPKQKISIYGPPPTSGTRDAFIELVMIEECIDLNEFKVTHPNKSDRKNNCSLIREDNVYLEAGENDNMIIHKLKANKDAFGIFGYSFLEQNFSVVQSTNIDGYEATFENIASKKYPLSRSLFVYLKDNHVKQKPEFQEFVIELISDDAIGEEGYTTFKGLIPLEYDEYNEMHENVSNKFSLN